MCVGRQTTTRLRDNHLTLRQTAGGAGTMPIFHDVFDVIAGKRASRASDCGHPRDCSGPAKKS